MTDTTTAGAASRGTTRLLNRRTALVSLGILAVLAPFVAILWLGVPSWFPSAITLDTVTVVKPPAGAALSLAPRLLWSLLLATGVVALLNLRGWAGRWLPFSLLMAGLAVSQACLWATAQGKSMEIGGLIPFSDASGYLYYAGEMLENHRIVNGFTDRPMFAAMLSSILQFTGPNLQAVLAAVLAFTGIGLFFAVREMRVRFGNPAAVCFLFVTHVFYNRSIGTLMTEQLGIALGLYSVAMLLHGLMDRHRTAWFAGLFFLTTALCARAGAFFILPPLCWITARRFRNGGRFSLPMFTAAIGVMIVPFALNRLLVVRVFDKATLPKSNVSYAIYGVLRGTNWTDAYGQFGSDHAKIRAAAFEIVKKKPFTVLHAVRRTWRTFFWEAYGFIFMGPEWSRTLLYAFLFAVALGIARATRSAYDGFAVAVGGGILASIPFVPPADCDLMRAYAATMPLHACLAATGIGAIFRLVAPAFRRGNSDPVKLIEDRAEPGGDFRVAAGFASLAVILVFVIPIGRSIFTSEKSAHWAIANLARTDGDDMPRVPTPQAAYSADGPAQAAGIPKGLAIHLVADESRTYFPNVRVSDFHARMDGFDGSQYKKEAAWLAALPPGVSLVNAGRPGLLVLRTEKLLRGGAPVDLIRFSVGWLRVYQDKELSLPNSEGAAPPPPAEKSAPQ